MFSIDLNIGNIVLEDGWDIDLSVEVISSYPSFLLWLRESLHKFVRVTRIRSSCALQKSDGGRGFYTSGKVPLEKTLEIEGISCCSAHDKSAGR